MSHEEYKAMLAARALDALDDADLRELDEHLAACAECQTALAELQDSAALLAHAAPQVEPRDEVGFRMMDQVRGGQADRAEPSARVVEMPQRPSTKRSPDLLRLAAAIAMVALLMGLVVSWKRNRDLQRDVAKLSGKLNAQQGELAQEREELQRERAMVTMLIGSDTKRMELTGTKEAKNARGMLAFDPKTGHAMLMTQGLPLAPAGKAYELWFIANGRPMPGKVFTVDASGRATISDQVPTEARDGAVFAITLEPKGGVSAPTGPIYLASRSS